MKIWQKLTLLVAIALIPFVIVSAVLWNAAAGSRDSFELETAGLETAAALRAPMEHMAQHLALSSAVISGDQSAAPGEASLASVIDGDLAAVRALDNKAGAFGMTQKLDAVDRGWRELKGRKTGLSAGENLERHVALMDAVEDMNRGVVERSGLRGDPDAGYVSATLMGVPGLISNLGRMGAAGLTSPKAVARVQLGVQGEELRRGFDSIRPDFQAAQVNDPALERWLQLANDDALRTTSTADYLGAHRAALDRVVKLADAASRQMQAAIQERISHASSKNGQFVAFVLIALVVIAIVAWRMYGGIRRQMDALRSLFSEIGAGNFEARAEVVGGGELAAIAGSVNDLLNGTLSLTLQSSGERDRLQNSIRKLLEEISDLAQGDLTVQAEVTEEATGAIADSFNYLVHELRTLIGNVQDTTAAVRTSAAEVESTNLQVATGSQSQATKIMEASAAIDDMLVSIADVSKNAGEAADVAEQALKSARTGADWVQKTIVGMEGIRQQVQQTAKRIKRLGEGSQEIGEIVELIGDIADRTSILALNASIQAAMAGEAGKGFAVVAEEVERLAERSTKATKKIAGLIRSIQSDTNEAIAAMEETTREVVGGSTLANEAGQRLAEIESVSNTLAELIQQILLRSREQSRGSDAVARSMGDISRVTQETASGTQRAVAAIRRLTTLAEELRGSLQGFKLPQSDRAAAA